MTVLVVAIRGICEVDITLKFAQQDETIKVAKYFVEGHGPSANGVKVVAEKVFNCLLLV